MKKIVIILVLILAAVGITFLVKPDISQAPSNGGALIQTRDEIRNESIILQDYVRYPGEEGKNAFELLQKYTKVEFKQYDFGVFIESINGVKPDEKHFWKLYYNGEESQVGADQLQTKKGDIVEWRLEEISN